MNKELESFIINFAWQNICMVTTTKVHTVYTRVQFCAYIALRPQLLTRFRDNKTQDGPDEPILHPNDNILETNLHKSTTIEDSCSRILSRE